MNELYRYNLSLSVLEAASIGSWHLNREEVEDRYLQNRLFSMTECFARKKSKPQQKKNPTRLPSCYRLITMNLVSITQGPVMCRVTSNVYPLIYMETQIVSDILSLLENEFHMSDVLVESFATLQFLNIARYDLRIQAHLLHSGSFIYFYLFSKTVKVVPATTRMSWVHALIHCPPIISSKLAMIRERSNRLNTSYSIPNECSHKPPKVLF